MCRSSVYDSITGRSHQSCVRWPKTTPSRAVCAIRSRRGSSPPTRARPPDGSSTPVSILIVVDLPAPFGPMKPTNSPSSIRNDTPSTARTRSDSVSTRLRSAPKKPRWWRATRNVFSSFSTSITLAS